MNPLRLPHLPWMPRSYNTYLTDTDLRQTWNALLNLLERRSNRETLRSYPPIIQAEVTKRCNIDCFMCLRENVPPEDMFPEVVERLVPLSRHISEMQLYGYGEPLISKPFYALIPRLECAKITFTTNGTVLAPKRLHLILESSRRPVYNINFSIDAATAETFEAIRGGANFQHVVDNLAYIDSYRKRHNTTIPKTEILFLAMRKNIAELPELILLAGRTGVSDVQVSHIIIWDEVNRDESLLYHPGEMTRAFAEAKKAASALDISLHLPALISIEPEGRNEKAPKTGPKCYWPWRHPVIKYNGDVQPCCAAPDALMGNIVDEPFESIWNGSSFRKFRRRVNSPTPPMVCETCDIRYRDFPDADGIEGIYIRRPPSNR